MIYLGQGCSSEGNSCLDHSQMAYYNVMLHIVVASIGTKLDGLFVPSKKNTNCAVTAMVSKLSSRPKSKC